MERSRQPAPGRHRGAGEIDRTLPRHHTTAARRRPPYARGWPARWPAGAEVIVYVGAGAWRRARSATHCPRHPRTLLPPGDDPAAYRWPVAGGVVIVMGDADRDALLALSGALLAASAVAVLWVTRGHPITRVEAPAHE